jgi:hypothetical protein
MVHTPILPGSRTAPEDRGIARIKSDIIASAHCVPASDPSNSPGNLEGE